MVQLHQVRGSMSGDVAHESDQTHISPGLMDKERRRFTSDLIRAIEELEQKRLTRSPQQLADEAWQKLQYDFPVIDIRELQALLEAFRASFVGKAGWPCYMLTHKALENISAGARGAGNHAPPLTQQEQHVQSVLLGSLSERSSRSSTGSMAHKLQPEERSQQQVFQQLAAVVLLQYTAKVAALPDQEAWHLLQAYCPEQPCNFHERKESQQQQQQQLLLHASQTGVSCQPQLHEATCTPVTTGQANASLTDTANATCSQLYHDTVADQQDSDGDAYEPFHEISPAAQQQYSGSCSLPQPNQLDSGSCSWPALRHKLLSLSEYVQYSSVSCDKVWQQQGASQHLLQVLRLLGVHSHSQELQPLLHAYVGLLVDRLAAAPQDLALLHQLWEALGLTLASGLKHTRHRAQQGGSTARSQGQAGLHPEAALGLSVCATVWQQLPTISARKQLWQSMHDHLVPLLECCAEQLAYSSSNSSIRSAKSPGTACETSVAFAHTLLLSHVVELLVLGRPAHVDVGKQLTDMGVTRSLLQLHMQWGCEQAAEPLRRALLLMCCSAPPTCSWVLAVPGVKQQLQQGHFSPGAPFEAHAALWQLLICNCRGSNGNAQKLKAQSMPTAVPADGVCDAAEQQLLALLWLPSSCLQYLQRQVVLLQLMADAQRATCGKQCLWSSQVLAALRKLAAHLKESGTSSSTISEHDEVNIQRRVVCSDSDSDDDRLPVGVSEEEPAGAGQHRKQRRQPDAQQLQHRRAAQLHPTALSFIKELLTLGGSKKD